MACGSDAHGKERWHEARRNAARQFGELEPAPAPADDVGQRAAASRFHLPGAGAFIRSDGPWDGSEVTDPGQGRVDLGGLYVPRVQGMELRMHPAGEHPAAVTVTIADASMEMQAFAAAKREDAWNPIRRELIVGIIRSGAPPRRSPARSAGKTPGRG
ncbi:DUF3710 domain-containing protein [Streptomyces sp. NPDC005533]|uniref:DUF3710 domain-containing protein n=1 Tax=Streptomyces sp. NPDC005533 TaxID=3364723 RepID=UPI0036C194FB